MPLRPDLLGLLIALTACGAERSPADTLPRIRSPGADPAALAALALPDQTPFTARTRISPTSLVDERGQVLLVLEAVGVQLEVQQVLGERARVRCTGCRAPVEGWVQRSALFVGVAPGSGPHDDWLAWLEGQAPPEWARLSQHGFALEGAARVAPPWYAEGGFTGPTLTLRAQAGQWAGELSAEPPGGAAPHTPPP